MGVLAGSSLVGSLALAAIGSICLDGASQNPNRLRPYEGPKLIGDTWLCTSDDYVAGGFWERPEGKATEQGARNDAQPKTTWRIAIKGQRADVIRFSGATQAIEEPEVYSVETTRTGGVLLVWQNRPAGFSTQVISIDPTNSSFVYSTQHVDPVFLVANRASIFFGSCRPYQ